MNLEYIIEDNSEYRSLDWVLYNKDKTTLICCPVNKTSVTRLDSVESVESKSCKNCRNLTDITIPKSVTKIGGDWSEIYSTFMGCDSLLNINIIEGNPEYSSVDGVVYNKDKRLKKFQYLIIVCTGYKPSYGLLWWNLIS